MAACIPTTNCLNCYPLGDVLAWGTAFILVLCVKWTLPHTDNFQTILNVIMCLCVCMCVCTPGGAAVQFQCVLHSDNKNKYRDRFAYHTPSQSFEQN